MQFAPNKLKKMRKKKNSPQRDFPTLLVLCRLLWRWKENWKSRYKYKKPNEWVLVLKGWALKVLIRRRRVQTKRVKVGPK